MALEPWYKVVTPRREVRQGRSFNPDEFAIALEQVVAGTAPEDYCNPEKFFSRTCFTRALKEHACLVLRGYQLKPGQPIKSTSCAAWQFSTVTPQIIPA